MPLTLKDCSQRLNRARNLIRCLDAVREGNPDRLNYVEIGTAFKEDEGLSTYVGGRFLKEYGLSGAVYSHEMKPENVEASQEIVRRYDPELMSRIHWVVGNSVATLPQTLGKLGEVDFGFVDGGGHPLYNLYEFLALWEKLSPAGLILVDDCRNLPPSGAYEGRRDFGKGQLILPYLMLAEFLHYQIAVMQRHAGGSDQETAIENTKALPVTPDFIKALLTADVFDSAFTDFADFDFVFLGANQILAGRRDAVARVRQGDESPILKD